MTLPNDTLLQQIQALQFQDRTAAEALLLTFIRATFPDLDATAVQLRPLAVSLNSFNGFLTLASGKRLFFKTHVEPGSVISEYYNTQLLADVGYPIIRPVYSSTEYGKQLLIYDVIESPSVFDVAHAIEQGERDDLAELTVAQNETDAKLADIYRRTLQWQTAEEAAQAPVHQLFYHRLGARYEQFYVGKTLALPGANLSWEELCQRQWVINGVRYQGTLGETIDRARTAIRPDQAGWSIIGHGDAHNGNVFFTPDGLVYFDPAFGGRHHPLLDLTKPLFHNVFATWMYHPQEVNAALHISWHDDGTTLTVAHDHRPSDCRRMFFASKIQVVESLIGELRSNGRLTPDWRTFLKSALLCCPLLTMNLADPNRFSPPITLLGLCCTVEMGMTSVGTERHLLNEHLDRIAD
ncbi:MAG: hypothetical protein IT324_05515 [Anaerolineae bacterium]|nr:hypothetical protein [Anaerolineae bacterium]